MDLDFRISPEETMVLLKTIINFIKHIFGK